MKSFMILCSMLILVGCAKEEACECDLNGDWVLRRTLPEEEFLNGTLTIEEGEGLYDVVQTGNSTLFLNGDFHTINLIEESASVLTTSSCDTLWIIGSTTYVLEEDGEQNVVHTVDIRDSAVVDYSWDCNVLTWVLPNDWRVWDRQ